MLRRVLLIALLAFITVPLAAQAPEGWRVRIDRSQNAQDPDDTPDLKIAATGNGYQVTGGPAGTFWSPAHRATGNYTLQATFTLMQPSGHVNYYGVIFGGEDLEGANQRYTYFLVAQNGTYIIRHRAGEEVTDIQPRTMHAAVRQPDANGRSTNALEVRVSGDSIAYAVNGTVVHTTPRSAATTDGLTGVRINHQLDVQVSDFAVQPAD
jgi:hypothetical protein